MHRVVAFVALVTHVLFVVFAVLGGFLAYLAPWVLLPHVASASWGAWVSARHATCPLSVVENWARAGSGRPALHDRGFVAHYAEDRCYPAAWTNRVVLGLTTVVISSWVGLALR